MVASHTARRTFATLAELTDVPRGAIMQMTGHQSESSYLKYVGGKLEVIFSETKDTEKIDKLTNRASHWYKAYEEKKE